MAERNNDSRTGSSVSASDKCKSAWHIDGYLTRFCLVGALAAVQSCGGDIPANRTNSAERAADTFPGDACVGECE